MEVDDRAAAARVRARAARAPRSPQFVRAASRAGEYVRHPEQLAALLSDASRKAEQPPSGRMGVALEDLKALIRLVTAYVRGEYRDVSRDNLVKLVAAIVYFVSPLDLVPDFLSPFGFTDDAVVVAFVLRKAREELTTFLAWEAQRGHTPGLPPGDHDRS